MPALTLSQAQAQLTLWIEADSAVSRSQSYTMGDRSLTRADAAEVTEKIKYWSTVVERLESGSMAPRVRRVIPRDL